ncbi:ParB/RepB/Spo0J family partition protein [Minwuia thermotolerans]|uniref:Fis family transcriptional regulator n=1 Tax=Minwuia thermotolerans TaxID=2056226 RepID=A0A2M9FWN6_9PROT|nr:ParB/RepB/Spo0J family partition protein [Minwuia thermotolerans]PJK27871.1 Fis family transcriptional regulator [Minwuia thermotolerans]
MTIETITLDQLNPPKANPRTSMDVAALEGLAASIKTDGLLQNLVVRPRKGKGYDIVSGERRYRALRLLAERGDIPADHPVPVDIRKRLSSADTLRLATIENIQREQLPPMDEAEAFASLLADGASLEDVAAKAGVSALTVKRRVALASLCDEVKVLVREGEVPLSVAEALTLGTHDQQRAVIERLQQGWHYDADDIRSILTGEKPSVALAIFPLEKYEGTYTADLFADEANTFFDDMEQFYRLQSEAVEQLADTHRRTAAFVEVVHEAYVPWWQYREAEDGEPGGVVIQFAPSGRVQVREGLVKREVRQSVSEDTSEAPGTPKPKPEYSGPVIRMVSAHKSLAVMEALLANPRKAKEVAVIGMMQGYDWTGRIHLDPHPALAYFAEAEVQPTSYTAIEREAGETAQALGIEADSSPYAAPTRGAWEQLLRSRKEPLALYEAVQGLTDAELEQLHLLLTALTFGQGDMDALDDGESLFNRIAADLEVDMRNHWRPDAAFLSRRRKDQLEAIAKESGAVKRMGRLKDYTKKAMVEALARHFERTKDAADDAPAHDRKGRDWLPGAMHFPAVTAEQGEAADDAAESEAEPVETTEAVADAA